MHILLVQPPNHYLVEAGVASQYNSRGFHGFPPIQIMSLSGYLKARTHHKVTMMDCQKEVPTYEEIQRRIAEINPDVVGTTSNTHMIYDTFRVVQAAKAVDPELPVIIGGSHVWAYPMEAMELPGVDFAVRGDGEVTLTELLAALEGSGDFSSIDGLLYRDRRGQVVRNAEREAVEDMDSFPFPDRLGLDLDGYFTAGMEDERCTTITSSRGCPYHCPFCSTYSTYRCRTPANIVDEMEECASLGITEVYFTDDTFNLPESRLWEFSREMLDRGVDMKWASKVTCSQVTRKTLALAREAGCVRLHFGVETGTDEGQRAIGKQTSDLAQVRRVFRWCREVGIKSGAYMMLGLPSERTEADIMRSAKFINSLDPTYVMWALYSPYPETELWDRGAQMGLWKGDEWLKYMVNPTPHHELPTAWTEHLSMEEQVRIMKKLMFRFYANPMRILRYLRSVNNLAELKRILSSGRSVMDACFSPVAEHLGEGQSAV